MYAGMAYLGAKAFPGHEGLGALTGMVGLKLATTEGPGTHVKVYSPLFGVDIPFSSQTVGLGILAALGISQIVLPAIRAHPVVKQAVVNVSTLKVPMPLHHLGVIP